MPGGRPGSEPRSCRALEAVALAAGRRGRMPTSSPAGPRAWSSHRLRRGRRNWIGRIPFPGRHEQADLLLLRRWAIADGDDLAAIQDRDPVRELEHLVELG